jgi:hypothetical protein
MTADFGVDLAWATTLSVTLPATALIPVAESLPP